MQLADQFKLKFYEDIRMMSESDKSEDDPREFGTLDAAKNAAKMAMTTKHLGNRAWYVIIDANGTTVHISRD